MALGSSSMRGKSSCKSIDVPMHTVVWQGRAAARYWGWGCFPGFEQGSQEKTRQGVHVGWGRSAGVLSRLAAAAGVLTAVSRLLVSCGAVGCEASGARHACALLLEARRVGVDGADCGTDDVAGINGVEETSLLDCRWTQ
jgi:hypothetical protein